MLTEEEKDLNDEYDKPGCLIFPNGSNKVLTKPEWDRIYEVYCDIMKERRESNVTTR